MKDIFIFIFKDIAIPVSAMGILLFVFRKYLSSKIDFDFKKQLAVYKKDLNLITKQVEFDYQRKIQDFNLYTTKKHEKYIELHKLLRIADGAILGLMGLQHEPTYEEYNKEDIRNMLLKMEVQTGKIDDILTIWDTHNKAEAIQEMRKYLQLLKINAARSSLTKANNFYLMSKLYFSDDVCAYKEKLADKLSNLFTIYQLSLEHPGAYKNATQESHKIRSEIKTFVMKLEKTMKDELSVGYYMAKNEK